MSAPLLEIRDLATHFFTDEGVVRAVDGVSLRVDRGEIVALVGESGSGKSVLTLSILRLVDPPGRIVAGEVWLADGPRGVPENLVKAKGARLRGIRGGRIAIVFQDPMTSLNPYLTIGRQLTEVPEQHEGLSGAAARTRCIEMLAAVGIPSPAERMDDHPHRLSGGMRQRVMIAMALLCKPDLLLADEPTTALDVTIQAQILELLRERARSLGAAVLLVTHDLGVVARMADRVAVMYAGRIVEEGPVAEVFASPRHPYTIGLARSVPRLEGPRDRVLVPIAGAPPSLAHVPPGCPFHPRCPQAIPICEREYPEARAVGAHVARCHVDVAGRPA